MHRPGNTMLVLSMAGALAGCDPVTVEEVVSGFDILETRQPINDLGQVGVVRAEEIEITDGTSSYALDISVFDLEITSIQKAVQLSDDGGIAFVATTMPTPSGCVSPFRGAYHLASDGVTLTTLDAGCMSSRSVARDDRVVSAG